VTSANIDVFSSRAVPERQEHMSNEVTLKAAFVAGLEVEPDVDFLSLAYRQIAEWDSLGHMQLISEIEDAFDIMLDTDDVIGLSSYMIACQILRKHGVDI
jgi:acyl carrier protein